MSGPVLGPVLTGADIDREARRVQVEGEPGIDGIDFVEVIGNYPGSERFVPRAPVQRTLLVHLLNDAVPADLDATRVSIVGGVRTDPTINPVRVVWAYPALAVAGEAGSPPGPLPAGVEEFDTDLVDGALPQGAAVRRRVLVVRTSSSGDWSTYLLRLLGAGGEGVPDGFDEPLSSMPFSFTIDCPSHLDCCAPTPAAVAPSGSPLQDYLARDYEALRARLVDRLSTLMPRWSDRNPADPAIMLAELFAALGDRLAYWQDAVAVEAYLGTARQRTSVRRHARLLDYVVHEGCSARVWLALTTDIPTLLGAGAAVADAVPAGFAPQPVEVHGGGGAVFETVADARLTPQRNQVPLDSWQDPDHVLPSGTTSAFLAVPAGQGTLGMLAGHVLVLADLPSPGPGNPAGGPVAAGDPAVRYAVRLDRDPVVHRDLLRSEVDIVEVTWHRDDALPGPLRVSEPAADGTAQVRAVALANVVLADHGASVSGEPLPAEPESAASGAPYRPRLARTGLAFVDPADPLPSAGAGALATPDPRSAGAALTLDDGERRWTPVPDLIGSSRFDAHVVVEPEPDGVARLRFGDGVTGRSPGRQPVFSAHYRLGGGSAGNVGSGRLTTWLTRPDGAPAVDSGAVLTVWNPLPAQGGTDPEGLDQVRQLAPFAFRTQLRAVTTDDYAAVAETVPGVQRSVDRRRWAGSWYVHEVTVDALASGAGDDAVGPAVASLLEVRRMAGVDVEVTQPVFVPLLVGLFVCPAAGYLAADVERALLEVLSARPLPGGATGLFHPDRFTFGQPLYVSDVVATAMAVPGVAWVDVTGFARLADPPSATAVNLAAGVIRVGSREVLQCDSDPNNPDAGRVDLVIGGGR